MGDIHHPRRGSMQFWPRKRSRHTLVRIRSWIKENKCKPLAFIGYKAGMTHLMVVDNRQKSLTKGEKISLPVTIVECPPMIVAGISFYSGYGAGIRKSSSIFMPTLAKQIRRKIQVSKKQAKNFSEVKEWDDLRLLVMSLPEMASTGTKKPKLLEVALGGSKEEKMAYAQKYLGKELKVEEVFGAGNFVDVHAVTKGKGFQGTVKRYGVPIRQHKAEKTKRGIGNLGSWKPKRVQYTVALPGRMGNHLRTEYNKQVLKIGNDAKEITPSGGLMKYGVLKTTYMFVKGSVAGPRKRALVMTPALRPDPRATKEAPEVTYVGFKKISE